MKITELEYKAQVSDVNEKGIKNYFRGVDGKPKREQKDAFEVYAKEFFKKHISSLKGSIIRDYKSLFRSRERVATKKKQIILANKYKLYFGYLKKKLESWSFEDLNNEIKVQPIFFESHVWPAFETIFENDKSLAHIKNSFKNILENSIYLGTRGGFLANFSENEPGIQDANEGDASQFLFLGRAILAGLNCSNVDVRSSKYDAILDREGTLTKIQIKGFVGNTLRFYSRPRGGRGIDSTHERNLGVRVSKKDCDYFSAVDKLTGICYNIPIAFIESLSEAKAKSCSLDEVAEFKEKWDFS